MKKAVILRGLPGSGKSTFVEKLKKKVEEISIVSKDNFRIDEKGKYFFDKSKEKEIEKKEIKLLQKFSEESKKLIIIDNLNLTQNSVLKYVEILRKNKYLIIGVVFEPTDFSNHADRNIHNVSENEIKMMSKHFELYFKDIDLNLSIKSEKLNQYSSHAIKKIVSFKGVGKIGFSEKSTDTEVLKRISVVAEMDLKGYSKEKIVRYAAENWKVSERQTETYLKRARETFIQEACSKNVDEHLAKVVMQHQDLYQKCYAIQDYAECRRILKDITDLLGLSAPAKIDHTTKGEKIQTPLITLDPFDYDDSTNDSTSEDSDIKEKN